MFKELYEALIYARTFEYVKVICLPFRIQLCGIGSRSRPPHIDKSSLYEHDSDIQTFEKIA